MATFIPPGDPAVSPVALDRRDLPHPLSNRLFRFYQARPRGRNVFMLTNGTITEDQPFTTYDMNGAAVAEAWSQVQTVWWGGHAATVNAAEVAALTAAGYGAYITP